MLASNNSQAADGACQEAVHGAFDRFLLLNGPLCSQRRGMS